MTRHSYDSESLIALIDRARSDQIFEDFIDQFEYAPVFKKETADGSDYEYIEFMDEGFCLIFENDILISVVLHEADDQYLRYTFDLPYGLYFNQLGPDVLKSLGEPDDIGGGHDKHFGEISDWARYNMDNYLLHIEFNSKPGGIFMVTILSKKLLQ